MYTHQHIKHHLLITVITMWRRISRYIICWRKIISLFFHNIIPFQPNPSPSRFLSPSSACLARAMLHTWILYKTKPVTHQPFQEFTWLPRFNRKMNNIKKFLAITNNAHALVYVMAVRYTHITSSTQLLQSSHSGGCAIQSDGTTLGYLK